MASIQRVGFTRSENDLSKIFKALGHPARISILNNILKNQRVMCKTIVLELPFSQPTVSRHLQILFETGLVGYEKVSNATYFTVNPLYIEMAEGALKNIKGKAQMASNDFSRVILNSQLAPESF